MTSWCVDAVLKQDSFGRVERLMGPGGELCLRRVAVGGRIPGSGQVARLLLGRERRALAALRGLEGVPQLLEDEEAAAAASLDGRVPPRGAVVVRQWLAGEALHRASRLNEDFFDHLDELVEAVHLRGVCHNDLHKEQNIVVGEDGFPWLIDFQLASVHRGAGRRVESRRRDDLRHVQKHRRRYTRDGRGPVAAGAAHGRGLGVRRSPLALLWRRLGKPVYNAVTRGLLRTRDGEERRDSSGPWPRWEGPLGPRGGT